MNTDPKNSRTRSGLKANPQQLSSDTNTRTARQKTLARITYERWLLKYRPIKNPFDSNASFDGCMFETYGADLQFVCAQHPRKIWTLLDCDGKVRICEGLHFVNRIAYFVTEVAAPEGRYFSIKAD